jgi:hypothetical protein
MVDTPLVSVISLTFNRRAKIAELLTALRRQTYPSFEVIVVDNASTDGTAEMIHTDFPEVRLLQMTENLRNNAYNYGIAAAEGDFLLMMDDDGLPASDDWIQAVVGRFRQDERLAVVACVVRMRDTGKVAEDSPQFEPTHDLLGGFRCPAYNGTGVGLRSRAIREVGYLYPRTAFFVYVELHVCTRLCQLGWQVRLHPDIEVWHSRPSGSSPPLAYYGLCNYYWYVWELYPWPYVLTETLHYIGSRLKAVLSGRVRFSLFWRATRDAFRKMPEAFVRRKPVSVATVRYLRQLRRHGNICDRIPFLVSFGGPKDS